MSGRAAHTASALPDGTVLVAGGCVTDGCRTATSETFVVARDGTTSAVGPDMSDARDSHTATVVGGGRVVLVGGFTGEGAAPVSSVDVFDPAARSITGAGRLRVGRGGHAAALTGDGRVLVVGGWVGPRSYTATTELIDPTSGAISPGPDLPVAADALDAVALADGRVLVTGGQVRSGVGTSAAAIFDPTTDTWAQTGPLLTPRFKHASVLLDDGCVLVIGGTTDDRDLLATTEIYSPTSGTFSRGPDLAEPRYKVQGGAVVLGGSRVAIAGGGQTVEVVDLDAGTSSVIDRFAARGSFATINVLGSGDLLVIGGYDDRVRLRNEAHLITVSGA